MRGEKIYEYDLDVTGMTDYGVSLDAILSGKEKIPPQGVRIDVAFEGRIDLDIRAIVETADGHRIALSADGVATPRAAEPIADLFENVSLSTAAEEYVWVNTRQVWGGWDREFRCWQDSHRRIHAVNVRPPF